MNSIKRYTRTLFCSVGFLVTAFVAGCGGGGGEQGRDPILGLPAATLVNVSVTPAAPSIAIGGTQQFAATATYSDLTSRDVTTLSSWTSATTAVASVNAGTGAANGIAAGSSVITASFEGKSGASTLTVNPATLSSIAIVPLDPSVSRSLTQQFTVLGTFSDSTTRDVTAVSTFTSASLAVATVDAASGLAVGVSPGTSLITATSGARTASTTLTVTPAVLLSLAIAPVNPTVQIGASRQLAVTASYSDGTTATVTDASLYSSATVAAATVNASGLATGVAAGSSVVSASFGGKTASTTVTVPAATLASIAVTPATATIVTSQTQRFVATGTYSDGSTGIITNSVTWTSGTPTVATVLPDGAATGLIPGSTTITATLGANSGSAALTVIAPVTLLSLAVTPVNPIVQIGANRQLTATASYSDGSTANVTAVALYSSATPAAATVVPGGLATGVAAGSSVVTASFGGRTASTTVTVPAATLTSIDVTPALATIGTGATQSFVATGTYADGSTGIITNSVVWTSGTPAVATIMPNGVATGLSAGDSIITATLGASSDTAVLTVTAVVVPLAPVLLGRADSFAVLAGTALTNNSGGITVVSGDVGSPSQTTDPVQSSGTNYKSGAILDGALADLDVAITDANSRTCTVSSAADIDLGGRVFTPGVYCYTGKINITGILTLSGPGVYIFRTASTLDSAVNSVVNLTGGASADNVYWVPVMPTTLAANTTFKGSILSRSAAITLGDTTTLLNGRVLSGAAVTLRNNKITK